MWLEMLSTYIHNSYSMHVFVHVFVAENLLCRKQTDW